MYAIFSRRRKELLTSKITIYNVGIYIRLSREDDDKVMMSESITNQKSLLLQYVKERTT